MVNQIRRAKKDGEPIYNLPMATQEYYRKNKAEMDALVAKEIDLLNKMYDKYKPKDEIDEGFKVGDKVTYLGHPAVVTATKEYNGRDFVSVSYDKGTGKTKASDILATDGTVKSLKEALNKRLGK